MKKAVLIIMSLAFAASAQASWKLRSAYKPVPGAEVDRSVLYFTSGDVTKTYAPAEPPFGLVSSDRYVTNKNEFYLTGWAKGSRSVLFRIFDMSKPEAKPICEITSFGETSKLKVKKGVLYVMTIEDLDHAKPDWKPCAKIK